KKFQNSNQTNIKYLSFKIIRDSLTRTQKMLSKEMDIAPSVIPLGKISQFKRQSQNFQVFSSTGFSTAYLLINLKNNFLKEKRLRKALSLTVNREEIIKYKLYGYAAPALSFINPSNYFFNKNLKPPEFNLKKAEDIINQMNLNGLELKLNCSNNSDTVSKARVLASQIGKAGLKISLQTNEWGAFYKDIGRGAFDLALMKWVGVVDPDIYRVAFHSESQAPQGRNRSFYKNKKLDAMLEQGFKERDKRKRKQIYDKVQELIAEEFVVIPLWHDQELSVVQTNVENYQMRSNGDFLFLPFVKKK
ncbi:MAG: ABC transporter substrate-binding protein, partial [Oligoflexia bacterium]|nr:ABC transporter substrate-binding protein [Oligoflexia bacterium]